MKYPTTSIIGMSKNAGKTTLLNCLIKKYEEKNIGLGIASIGIDGEKADFLTGQPKPSIQIPVRALVATTEQGLREGNASWRILDQLQLNSITENVYIAETLEAGNVKLMGAYTVESINEVISAFKRYEVEKIIIDGAYDRFSNASPILADEIFLVIGASLHKDDKEFSRLLGEKLFSLFYPLTTNKEAISQARSWRNEDKILLKRNGEWFYYPSTYLISNRQLDYKGVEVLLLPGVLTEQILINMLKSEKGFPIILQNGLKSFVSSSLVGKWKAKGGTINVLDELNIKGIAYNPYSPHGYSFQDSLMRSNIYQLIEEQTPKSIPIFNVWKECESNFLKI